MGNLSSQAKTESEADWFFKPENKKIEFVASYMRSRIPEKRYKGWIDEEKRSRWERY